MRVGVRGGFGERVARGPGNWRPASIPCVRLSSVLKKTLQKMRLRHQPTGACGLEVGSSALCPFLAVLGEARPKRGAQLAESTWDFLEPEGGRFHHFGPQSGHLHGTACSLCLEKTRVSSKLLYGLEAETCPQLRSLVT